MVGDDFPLIEAWLVGEERDARAGDGRRRHGDTGQDAPGAEESRANQRGTGLVAGRAGDVPRAGQATKEDAGESPSAREAASGEAGAEEGALVMGGAPQAAAGIRGDPSQPGRGDWPSPTGAGDVRGLGGAAFCEVGPGEGAPALGGAV